MEQRMSKCESELKESSEKIEDLEGKLQNITIEKTSLEGSLKRIFDKMDTLEKELQQVRTDFSEYKKENKKDLSSIGADIKAFHDCLTTEKINNAKNSTIIAVILPIIILAIGFFLGIK